jgi:hypothetical protein
MQTTKELNANQEQILYVVTDERCYWGKGLSLKEAVVNYRRAGRKGRNPKKVAIYLCLKPLEKEEAFRSAQIDWVSLTYSNDNVILLSQSDY